MHLYEEGVTILQSVSVFLSVCVITYNSSKTILDTLNSIRRQTTKDFELIISDDCSTDDTCELVRNWLHDYGSLFISCQLISTPKNMGVAENCNLAVATAQGHYIKLLAGDDMLADDAAQAYIHFLSTHCSDAVFAKVISFSHTWMEGRDAPDPSWQSHPLTFTNEYQYEYFKKSPQKQFRIMLNRYPCKICGFCFKKEIWEAIHGFDSAYYQEDHPFLVRLLASGYQFHFIDAYLAYYRVSDFSVTNSHTKQGLLFDLTKLANHRKMVREVIWPELKKHKYYMDLLKWKIRFFETDLRIKVSGNKNACAHKIYSFFHFLLWFPLYPHRIHKAIILIKNKMHQTKVGDCK